MANGAGQNAAGPALPDGLRRVLILGLGKVTGAAVAEAMLELGRDVRVSERERSEANVAAAEKLSARGVEVLFGEDRDVVEWADLLVPSPGVPPSNPLLSAARERGIPVWSEIEVGWRLASGPVLAITGTNGKTTTTELLTAILNEASARGDGAPAAVAAGNIGLPLIEAARRQRSGTVFVTEVSSFQLAHIDAFRPATAVVLNVADDHYDWHRDYSDYLGAKARITKNQRSEDWIVANAADDGALSIAAGSKAGLGVFGTQPPGALRIRAETKIGRKVSLVAGIEGDSVVVSRDGEDTEILDSSDIRLRGRPNLQNVLAACAAAFNSSRNSEAIRRAVRQFRALPHRMSVVAEKDGVTYIDDSKATNPHAALAALEGMQNVILIAGGRSKGISLAPLADALPAVKSVVVMGEAAAELREVFARVPLREAGSVEEAVMHAAGMAIPGDTVLLSPGCSSLDQYSSYSERGDRFATAVQGLR